MARRKKRSPIAGLMKRGLSMKAAWRTWRKLHRRKKGARSRRRSRR